ncbi:hypothetical protein [Sabulicella glaciei]|uniref:Uncharacterized protein n=1 Tax=Sabulicella glaciei TaxID=2984948 RepID=A0ABT3NQW2_9PROT|nr:hypothetical protein [Roseococcus sp. MDT2-1-1]MCW8084555.1 hypothetical protein [Roseococcus sp. MDT2-1-1]
MTQPFPSHFTLGLERSDAPRAIQAIGPLLLAAMLAGCGGESPQFGRLWREATGQEAAGRLAPPGIDRPAPNLASVPPIPERPDLAARQSLTRRLEEDRSAAERPAPRRDPGATEAAPGAPDIAAAPPAPPRIANAPAVPWTPPRGGPAAPSIGPAPTPGEVPAPPPPELLAPAPPPPDLLAPAPPLR